MKALIEFAVTILMAAVLTGNLPTLLKKVRKAQAYLIIESRTSNWGRAWTPPKTH